MHRRLLTFISLLLFACGSQVVQSSSGTSSGAGGASSTTSSGAHASSSASLSASSSTAFVAASSSSGFTTSSGAGGHPPCDQGSIDIQGDGPDQHYVLSCPNTWGASDSPTALGYNDPGGGGFLLLFALAGCATPNMAASSLFVDAIVSSGPDAMNGNVSYNDPAGVSWSHVANTGFFLHVSQEAMQVGDYYDGQFKVEVSAANHPDKVLAGTFHVCRVPDMPPKP